ncbi:DUF4349 domain-containing protein [Sphingomonas jatrophae]|uniref:DUF4349 domain-containing protein n=1 Tax=Sphingomonas jatrophae TaxID=1166337 RepID=A0A1I6JCL5_9SPHN|nr:DUF4349 domain-containing protein [Sphingomonas jatrophae]SFR76652.1 protein of unknown function [Sphingomonas jatrophae]
MSRWITLTIASTLLLAGCSKPAEQEDRFESTQQQMEAAPSARATATDMAPDVNVTAAPGVAFNYRYAFRLPAARIGAVQERHAQACEAMGVSRCRITGMLYRVRSADDVEARLSFKLAPADARAFGKAGVAEVTKAEGMLVESEITGEDVGQRLADGGRTAADLEAEAARLERQQTSRPPRDPARITDAQRLSELRDQLRSLARDRAEGQEALARTPVTFNYGSGRLVPGFEDRSSLLVALDRAGANIVDGLAVMIVLVATLLPWALLLLIGWAAFRVLAPRLRRRGTGDAPAAD